MTRSSFIFNSRLTNMLPMEWTRKKPAVPRFGYWAG